MMGNTICEFVLTGVISQPAAQIRSRRLWLRGEMQCAV